MVGVMLKPVRGRQGLLRIRRDERVLIKSRFQGDFLKSNQCLLPPARVGAAAVVKAAALWLLPFAFSCPEQALLQLPPTPPEGCVVFSTPSLLQIWLGSWIEGVRASPGVSPIIHSWCCQGFRVWGGGWLHVVSGQE